MNNDNKDNNPAATTFATNASTLGAVHVYVSSVKGQQVFHKTKDLTDGPKYYLEDDEKLAGLELDSVASNRASERSEAICETKQN